jgi:glycosyltransferase involved in cell wall biosynthesis
VIAFVGHLAPHTNPGPFFDMLDRLVSEHPEVVDRVCFRIVGQIHEAVRKQLDRFAHPTMIERVGLLPLSEAQREMAAADALILFAGSDLSRYLPGKLFEYLAARRPIIVYGEPGEADDLVSSLSVGRRVSGTEDFVKFLEDLQDIERQLEGPQIDQWLAEHRRDALAKRFYEILERIIGT